MEEDYQYLDDYNNSRTLDLDDYYNGLSISDFNFPNTLWHVKPATEMASKSTAMVFIGITGLYLNYVILAVLTRNRWLWSASNFLIGNMAFVDFLILLLCPWFTLVRDFYQNYVLKDFGCRFEGFMQATLLLANVGSVVMVSYDRLAAAVLTNEAKITKSAAPKLIALNWAISIGLSIPWITNTNYMERQWKNHLEKFCFEDVTVLSIYWHFILILLVWIPLAVMILTYSAILWRLECTARKLKTRGGGQSITRAKSRAMKVTACILAVDIVCRMPYSVMVYWRSNNDMQINSVDGEFAVIWFLAHFLMYLNCAVNPLIYGFTNTRFLKAMDRTPGVACFKFGSWCCTCILFKKRDVEIEDKHTQKIFVIESSPQPNKKLSKIIKNVLHINKDAMDLTIPKENEAITKPTKVTPLPEDI